jgi:hypothetical protein
MAFPAHRPALARPFRREPASSVLRRTAVATLLMFSPCAAAAQEPYRFTPPIAGSWEPIQSMGQPSLWKPFLGFGFGVDGPGDERQAGPTGSIGVYRDLGNPMYGILGMSAQLYAGQRGERFDAGARLMLGAPLLYVHGGLDWNTRWNRRDWIFSLSFPTTRGGWFRRGGELRLDWIPARDDGLIAGASVPIGQPFSGRTRPRSVSVSLPDPPRSGRLEPPRPGSPAHQAVLALDRSMSWIIQLHNIFWLTEHRELRRDRSVDRARAALAEFRTSLDARESLLPERNTYEREVAYYHRMLERAFGLAVALGADAEHAGRPFAARARAIVLEEVVLPYNRTVGRYKEPDVLDGLTARARARFIGWLEVETGLGAEQSREALRVLDAWLDSFESTRRQIDRLANDSRMHWLPLALVLTPGERDTQADVDALIATALGRGFSAGNATHYFDARRFQHELQRTIHETSTYHVLWLHDYRGRNEAGEPDRIGFEQTTRGYLAALLSGVRRYDERGRMPAYILMLDQHYYEANDSRLWLSLLEQPLTHRVRLSAAHEDMRQTIEAYQDSLRVAVSESRRLQAEAVAFGSHRIEQIVKVHVNVTNPSDFSFRSRHLLGIPFGADNVMRDHRKIVIRDVTDADPARGEVILAGTGVGEAYASASWEDRAIILQGPAALTARDAAREVLETNGLRGDALPPPLRAGALAPDYASRANALVALGADARVLQVHNRTGWGDKDATFVQMLLYDLAPPGTVLYIPDSLWTNFEWMAQLVSAALRGCRVYVVAPALANAPTAGFAPMSRMQELVTRLVLVGQEFSEAIDDADGELRIGLYTRQANAGDVAARLDEVETGFRRHPFLSDLFPFPDSVWQVLKRGIALRGDMAGQGPTVPSPGAAGRTAGGAAPAAALRPDPVRPSDDRLPRLHSKTQLIASGNVIAGMARAPGTLDVLIRVLRDETDAVAHAAETGPLIQQERVDASLRLLRTYEGLPGIDRDRTLLYFATGSLNKDVRGMALDGEVLAVVAGRWALQPYIDFFLLSGAVSWIDSIAALDALMPPSSVVNRWIGRRLRRIM